MQQKCQRQSTHLILDVVLAGYSGNNYCPGVAHVLHHQVLDQRHSVVRLVDMDDARQVNQGQVGVCACAALGA
jgi:hypothetical protein